MRKILFAGCIVLSLASCKEHASLGVILNDSTAKLSDTTYTAAVEAVTAKKVLVEEFTGASCPNCPDARTALATIAAANPNRLIVLEVHNDKTPQGKKIEGVSKYDFTNAQASELADLFYPGLGSIPQGGVDRVISGSTRLMPKSAWGSAINSRLSITTSANIKLTNTYDDTKREGVIKVHIGYTVDVPNKQNLTVALIEDDIVDAQEYTDSINHNYTFKHVFRKIFTATSGSPVLDSIAIKKAGRVYEGGFKYTIDPAWVPANCRLVVFLQNNEGDNKEILQAEEINVK
jgi:hypothetical protein